MYLRFCTSKESESEVTQSCPTLCDPWTVAHQAPPSMGFSRQEYWSGLLFPSPRNSKPTTYYIYPSVYEIFNSSVVVVPLLSHVQFLVTPWTAAHQASLYFTISWCLLKLFSIESMMTSSHFILYHALLLLPSIFCSIRFFSNEYSELISFKIDWFDLPAVQAPQFKSINSLVLTLLYGPIFRSILDY